MSLEGESKTHLLTVRVKGGEGVLVHVSSKRHHAGVGGAQQTLSQSQDGGEIPSHHLKGQHTTDYTIIKIIKMDCLCITNMKYMKLLSFFLFVLFKWDERQQTHLSEVPKGLLEQSFLN